MRPSDTIFQGQESLPTWTVTLVRELNAREVQTPSHLLTSIAALDEVVATARSVAGGRQIQDADRVSLQKDVSTSLDSLGPAVQRSGGAILRAFQTHDLRKLPQLLADVDGASRLRSSVTTVI